MVVTNAEKNLHEVSDSKCNHRQQSPPCDTVSVGRVPVSQPQRHGAHLPGRKSGDEALHLAPDASHQFGHSGAVDAAQVQLFLKTRARLETQLSHMFASEYIHTWQHWVTYFDNPTEFHITDGQLLVSLLGNNFLQHFLQTFANFSLDKGSGS